jgi:hypothetical protein
MNWIFQLSPWMLGLLIVSVYLAAGLGGLCALRGRIKRIVGADVPVHNAMVSSFLSAVGTFCGLLLGLVAITAWRGHSDASSLVTHEATTLAALYRDVGGYPEPARGELRALTREYVRYVIEDAWPVQRQCIVPEGGVARAYALFTRLARFDPATPRDTAAHREAMRAFNIFFEARRERLDAVTRGLPATLWWVVSTSGFILIAITWLFVGPALRTHAVLTAALAGMIGLLIFLIAALDRPFCGPMGVDSVPFELVRDQLMK